MMGGEEGKWERVGLCACIGVCVYEYISVCVYESILTDSNKGCVGGREGRGLGERE